MRFIGWLGIYKRVRPAEDSVGVNSIEQFLMLRLFAIETFFCNPNFIYSKKLKNFIFAT